MKETTTHMSRESITQTDFKVGIPWEVYYHFSCILKSDFFSLSNHA